MPEEKYKIAKAEFKKKMLAELFKTKKALVNYENDIFNYTFDRAYILGKQDKDAEGEEILACEKSRVQQQYKRAILLKDDSESKWKFVGDQIERVLIGLYGSMCMPDEAPLSQNPSENCDTESHISTDCDKPSEPKFTVGDIAVVRGFKHPLLKQDGAIVTILSYHEKGDFYSCAIAPNVGIDVDAKCLEPYTEPTFTDDCQSQSKSRNLSQEIANCAKYHIPDSEKMIDNPLKDSFAKERRLNIAAMMAQGILSNIDLFKNVLETGMVTLDGDDISCRSVAKASFLFADTLIAESEKGGNDVED